MRTFLKLYFIYADDTVILALSENQLKCFSTYEEYCDTWKVTVSINMSKIPVFSKRQGVPIQFYF